MPNNISQSEPFTKTQNNSEEASDTLESWQAKSLSFVLISTSIAAIPTFLSSFLTAIDDGLWFNLVVYPCAYVFCLILTFYRKIPFKTRSWLAVLGYFLLGSLGMFTAGLIGSGRLLLFTSGILATLTLGIPSGIIILFSQLGVIFLYSYLINQNLLHIDLPSFQNVSMLVTTSCTFLFLSIISVVAMGLIIRGLNNTLHRYRKNRDELRVLSERLQSSLESLQESEERWSFALEGAGDGVWDWDIPSAQVYFSPRWKQMLGFSDNEIGTSPHEWHSRVHPDDRHEAEHILSQFSLQSNVQSRIRLQCKDGSYKWLFVRGKVIDRSPSGEPLRVIGTCADISLIKQLEEQQIAYEARLQQTYKMEAIGTLAGGIAHDFNNILGSILGYSELAKRHIDPESKQYQHINQVVLAGNRAKALVQQILAFSRQSEKKHEALDLIPLIKETATMLRPSLPATIKINLNLPDKTSQIYGDPTELNQILLNLCTNAFHAMEKKGGSLSIELQECYLKDQCQEISIAPGHYLLLSVSDSGVGIPTDVKNRIFDPYFTTKDQGKGSGMGLSIVHGIMRSYGGSVTCSSEVGVGTRFHLYFPVANQIMNNKKPDTNIEQSLSGIESILFIDDETQLCNLVKEMLEDYGYSVTVMNDSVQAYETFKLNPQSFDIIVTDQTMPHLTGVDLAQKVHNIRPDIPIILCTGYSSIVTEQDAFNKGVSRYLLKPFTAESLAVEIRSVFKNRP